MSANYSKMCRNVPQRTVPYDLVDSITRITTLYQRITSESEISQTNYMTLYQLPLTPVRVPHSEEYRRGAGM